MPFFLFSVLSTLQVCAVRKCRGKARCPVRLEELVHAAGGDSCTCGAGELAEEARAPDGLVDNVRFCSGRSEGETPHRGGRISVQ